MARKPKRVITEGTEVLVRGRVTWACDDPRGAVVVVQIHGALIETKVQLREEDVEPVPEA